MLTPKQIVEKSFSATQLKRGYSEKEVDEFLDEVAVAMRQLIADNSELQAKNAEMRTAVVELIPSSVIVEATIVEPAVEATTSAIEALLTLATKLHDQHVAEGERTKMSLISEGQAELANAKWAAADLRTQQEKMVTSMRQQARGIIAEAETEKVNVLACLQAEKSVLTSQVSDLITAKADAHASIRIYYQEQLNALSASDSA